MQLSESKDEIQSLLEHGKNSNVFFLHSKEVDFATHFQPNILLCVFFFSVNENYLFNLKLNWKNGVLVNKIQRGKYHYHYYTLFKIHSHKIISLLLHFCSCFCFIFGACCIEKVKFQNINTHEELENKKKNEIKVIGK